MRFNNSVVALTAYTFGEQHTTSQMGEFGISTLKVPGTLATTEGIIWKGLSALKPEVSNAYGCCFTISYRLVGELSEKF